MLWSFTLEGIIPLCKEFEEKLIKYVWRNRGQPKRDRPFSRPAVWGEGLMGGGFGGLMSFSLSH